MNGDPMREVMHLSDTDLAQIADGEVSARGEVKAHEHLASCSACRERLAAMERAGRNFAELLREDFDGRITEAAGPRALLRARLEEAAQQKDETESGLLNGPSRYGYRIGAFAASAILAVAVGALAVSHFRPAPATVESADAPDPRFTPGATVPLTREQVCRADSPAPVVPAALRQQVFAEYGIAHPRPESYEVDYLITPELGGATNIRNLWPQPYYDTIWNASVKDQLEGRLHSMVCDGEMELTTAQHEIASNWITAYKKYFHTDRPLVNVPPRVHSNSGAEKRRSPAVLAAIRRRTQPGSHT